MSVPEFVYTVLLRPRPLRAAANAMLRAISPASVDVHGATIVLNPNDPVISGALTLGVYEGAETKVFRRLCSPGMTFLDVGANVGYYTGMAMGALGSQGKIIALEPDVESFGCLQKTVAANSGARVQCIRLAAGAEAGHATLFTSADNRGDNRLYANELATGTAQIEVTRVDDLLTGLGLEGVDLVKMDVQGYEGKVLDGMQHTLESGRPMSILFEFWPDGLARAGSNAGEVMESLVALGFALHEITPGGDLEPLVDRDALIRRLDGRKYTNLVASRTQERAHA